MADEGSKSQKVKVIVSGVPLSSIIDSGADITIMGRSAFKQVAAVATLKKRDFKPQTKFQGTMIVNLFTMMVKLKSTLNLMVEL